MVEINADAELPKTVKAIEKKGNVYTQKVEHEFIPPRCKEWKCFGHSITQGCSNWNKPKQVRVPKLSTSGSTVTKATEVEPLVTEVTTGTKLTPQKMDTATKGYTQKVATRDLESEYS